MKTLSLAALLALGVSIPSMAAAELQKISVVLGYIVDSESHGPIYAQLEGLFAEEGLDVEIIPAGAGVDQVQMVASGQATIGIVGPEQIFAGVNKGEPMKIFAAQFQRTPNAMTCRKDSGVTQPSELVGKKLGLKTSATATGHLFLKKNNVGLDQLEIVSIGQSDISMLVAGQVDCMLTTFAFNEPRMIEDLGVPVNVISMGDYGMNSQINSYFVTEDFYNQEGNKDLLTRYLRAEAKAWEVFYKDPAAGAKYILDTGMADGLDLDQQIFQSEEQVKYMSSDLTREKGLMWISTEAFTQTVQNAFEAGLTTELLDLDQILTFEILEAAQPAKL